MPITKLGDFAPRTPFLEFICGTAGGGCGSPMKKHFIYRPDRYADVNPIAGTGRKPNGKFYCRRDQSAYSGGQFQRQLRRTLEAGYRGQS